MTPRQPDWDIDRASGEEAEQLYRNYRAGILAGSTEVKRDDRARDTGNVYVEYECLTASGWRPSGIATTKATTWVFVVWPTAIALSVWVLKLLAREAFDKGSRGDCTSGTHPTHGVLLPLNALVPRAIEITGRPVTEQVA